MRFTQAPHARFQGEVLHRLIHTAHLRGQLMHEGRAGDQPNTFNTRGPIPASAYAFALGCRDRGPRSALLGFLTASGPTCAAEGQCDLRKSTEIPFDGPPLHTNHTLHTLRDTGWHRLVSDRIRTCDTLAYANCSTIELQIGCHSFLAAGDRLELSTRSVKGYCSTN